MESDLTRTMLAFDWLVNPSKTCRDPFESFFSPRGTRANRSDEGGRAAMDNPNQPMTNKTRTLPAMIFKTRIRRLTK